MALREATNNLRGIRMIRKFVFAFLAACLTTAAVPAVSLAADVLDGYVPASRFAGNWTGGYVGAAVGFSIGDVSLGTPTNPDAALLSPSGFHALVQLGYDWQLSHEFIGGIRLMAPIASVSDDVFSPVAGTVIEGNGKYALIAAGRIGYPMGNAMPYIFGGFVWARGEANNPGCCAIEADHTGGIIGIGYEQVIAPGWTLDAHYSYMDLSEEGYNFAAFGGGTVVFGYSSHNFTVGVNYRFPPGR
jgi:opacity protein-like surface antigen